MEGNIRLALRAGPILRKHGRSCPLGGIPRQRQHLEGRWFLRRQILSLQVASGCYLRGNWAIYWRRQWQPTPVLLPGKSHGQRSLVGCSPWGPKSRTRLSNWTELIGSWIIINAPPHLLHSSVVLLFLVNSHLLIWSHFLWIFLSI